MKIDSEGLKNKQLIFVDTCSLMNIDSFIKFVESNKDYLHLNNQKITIIGAVHFELNNHIKGEYEDRKMQAKKALDYIYANKYIFDIRKRNEFECFADHTLQVEILNNRRHKTQVLITEDHKLAIDIFGFNDIESCDGKYISVFSLDKEGHLYFPEYLNSKQVDHSINTQFSEEKAENVTTKNLNSDIKELAILVSGILSGLAAPFVLKKIKSCF